MMSNPSQYYGMANGYAPATNGPQQQQSQFPPTSQQQVMPPQQQYPAKNIMMNGPSQYPPGMPGGAPQYGVPQTSVAPVPLQNGPPMTQKPLFNTQLPQPNNRVANLVSNGNSATSSRTSSPALVNNNIPASQLPPSMNSRPGTYPTPSSQSQQTATPPTNNYTMGSNNNWTSGIPASTINTPPKTASGLSTPLNASTPTLGMAPLNGPVNSLTASMQNLNVNRPPSAQQQINHVNGSGTQNPPISSSSYTNQPQPGQVPPMKPPNVSQPTSSTQAAYGQLPPLTSQQGRPVNGNHVPNLQMPPQPQQQNLPPSSSAGQSYPGMPPAPSVVTSATSAIGKRPLYPSQTMPPMPTPQQTNSYYPNQQQQQPPMQGMQQNQQFQQPHQHSHLPHQHHHHHQQQQVQQQQQLQQPYGANYQQQPQQQDPQYNNVVRSGFNRLWGNNTVDLLQNRHILPVEKVRPPPIHLNHPFQEAVNCNPE